MKVNKKSRKTGTFGIIQGAAAGGHFETLKAGQLRLADDFIYRIDGHKSVGVQLIEMIE